MALYKYEPFDITLYTNAPIASVTPTPNLTPFVTRVDPSAVVLAGTYNGAPSSNESIRIVDVNGTVVQSNYLLNAGRFFDVNRSSFNNRTLSLFKNEPLTPILFDSEISLSRIQTVPTLPPGLSFVSNSPTSFLLQGTPLVQIPTSNYLVIGTGTNAAQVVTTQVFGTLGANGGVNIGVGAERIQLDLSGSPTVSPMVVGTPIAQRVITARPPSPGSANVQYNWNPLPDGLQFSKKDGTPVSGTSVSLGGGSDASFTLVLDGAPTLNAAKFFRGQSNYTVNVQVFRTSPAPILSNTTALTFAFQPMVLFDDPFPSNVQVFRNSAVPLNTSFRARTYFATTDVSITSMTQTGFPVGLDVSFVATDQRGYLVGTPTTAGVFTGTIFASTGSITGSNPITISVSNDTVSFVPPTATSNVSFIVSRPLSSFKDGYYTSNVQFRATAASLCNVTYSVSGLAGTGIQTTTSNGTLTLTGIPTTVVPPSTLTVTASSPTASASTSLTFQIVNDTLTFLGLPSNLTYLQHEAIQPIQIQVQTLSERPVQRFFSDNLPSGLEVTPTGILRGAPLINGAGTFTITASTGFVTASTSPIAYSIEADNLVALLDPVATGLVPGQPIVPANVKVVSKSGATVSNLQLQQLDPSYGVVLTSTGVNTCTFGGTFTNGNYATSPLLSNILFSIQGQIGNFTGNAPLTIQTQNGYVFRRYMVRNWHQPSGPGTTPSDTFIYSQDDNDLAPYTQRYSGTLENISLSTDYLLQSDIGITDFQIQNPKLSGYVQGGKTILCARNRSFVIRSLDGTTFAQVGTGSDDTRRIYQLAYISGETWIGIGYRAGEFEYTGTVRIYRTDDNGTTWTDPPPNDFPDTLMGANLCRVRYPNGLDNYAPYNYLYAGSTCLRYKDGVLIAGGSRSNGASSNSLLRSTDEGVTWEDVVGQFNSETYTINLEGDVWLIGGSDVYRSEDPSSTYTTPASTIRYSTDQGQTWNATSGDFNFTCLDIVYGEGRWIAYGMSYVSGDYQLQFRYSTNGVDWFPLTGVPNPDVGRRFFTDLQVPRQDKIMFDGLYWNIYIVTLFAPKTTYVRSFRQSRVGDFASNWTEFVIPNIGYFRWKEFDNINSYQQHDVLGPPGGGYFIPPTGTQTSVLTSISGRATFSQPHV